MLVNPVLADLSSYMCMPKGTFMCEMYICLTKRVDSFTVQIE